MRTKAHITARGKTRSIFIRLSYGAFERVQKDDVYVNGRKYRRIEYYTGETVKPSEWDVKKGKTKNNSYLNTQIEKGCLRIQEIYSGLSYNKDLEHEALRDAIKQDALLADIFQKEREIEPVSTFKPPLELFKEFIELSKETNGTKKDYRNSLTHLSNFDNYRGKKATYKSMGFNYYLELVNYLQIEKRLKGSTTDKIIKNLKVFLNYADLQDNIEVNQDFKKKTTSGQSLFAKVSKEEAEHVYLDEIEIKQITNADMADERLSEIKDLFVIGCWTGLRVSDLKRLEQGNINNGLLSIKTQKTKTEVVIPVTAELRAVLNKYPEQLPKIPSDQHYNREIKKVCEIAGITTKVMAEVKTNGMTVTKQVPKYELITSHTARRSFATNLYRRGIPSTQLMMLTGHKSETSFMKYIKVNKADNAKDVAKKLRKLG